MVNIHFVYIFDYRRNVRYQILQACVTYHVPAERRLPQIETNCFVAAITEILKDFLYLIFFVLYLRDLIKQAFVRFSAIIQAQRFL